MRVKLIPISLIIFICIFSLIISANAQDENTIKSYEYLEGTELAKSTGKNMIIFSNPSYLLSIFKEKTKAELDKFIYIRSVFTRFNPIFILQFPSEQKRMLSMVILDSEGREITRIESVDSDLVRFDIDGKETKSYYYDEKTRSYHPELLDDFYYETFKYAESKKGKVQRLPQDLGLISVKDLIGKQNITYATVSGFIRDIKSNGYYEFIIDDGTGLIKLGYFGGLGDIKEGDKVFVKILTIGYNSGTAITISKENIIDNAKSDGMGSVPKTSGFEVIIGVVGVLFAWRKIINK